MYLFTDESGGTYNRPLLFLIPGEGGLSSGPWRRSFGPWRLSSEARTAFLRGQDGFPPESDRPSFRSRAVFHRLELSSSSSRTGYLRGQGDLPVNGYLFMYMIIIFLML
jgi:hypothetical protein